jgi:multicomponent Na+:H+ antiporter subunit E
MKPGIVKVPLNVTKDIEILMLNNLITMTPGTICVNIKSDKSTMYVHAMYINNRDELIKEIKTIEFKILTLFHHD